MNSKVVRKLILDIIMTVCLFLLMAYELIGRHIHEWIGVGLLLLLVVHHIFNRRWSKSIFKGKYSPYRILQTMLVILLIFCMLTSMFSGIVLSRYIFNSIPIQLGHSLARNLHMISGYWGFVLMSLHLGLHWNLIICCGRKFVKGKSLWRVVVLRIFAGLISVYAIYALIERNILNYMFLKEQFVFFNFEEPLAFFFIDYISVCSLFICIAYYIGKAIKQKS